MHEITMCDTRIKVGIYPQHGKTLSNKVSKRISFLSDHHRPLHQNSHDLHNFPTGRGISLLHFSSHQCWSTDCSSFHTKKNLANGFTGRSTESLQNADGRARIGRGNGISGLNSSPSALTCFPQSAYTCFVSSLLL